MVIHFEEVQDSRVFRWLEEFRYFGSN